MYATISGSAAIICGAVRSPSWNAMIVPSRSRGSTRAAICAAVSPAQSLLSMMFVPESSTIRRPSDSAVYSSAALTAP